MNKKFLQRYAKKITNKFFIKKNRYEDIGFGCAQG